MTSEELAAQDWFRAEKDYDAQRALDGNIPHQMWRVDNTIERRAYRIFLARTGK